MKSFDKRKVPGLENCSSDSDDEDGVPLKKPCKVNDIEIELEVQENEFLVEHPTNKINNKMKKFNNIWGDVVQESILDESFNKVGVNKMNVRRNVESYSIGEEESISRKRKHRRKNNGNAKSSISSTTIKERVESRSYNKNKDRSHIQINLEKDTKQYIAEEIAKLLNEPKVDLIEKCINVLGTHKILEFYYMTEDIEENGGLLVVNGSRRRTTGGVFLTLIKDSESVDDESKRLIFDGDKGIPQPNLLARDSNDQVEIKNIVQSNDDNCSMETSNFDQTKVKNDEELEEGEII